MKPSRPDMNAVLRGLLVLATFWLIGFALVQLSQRFGGGWAVSQSGQALACGLGVIIALRLRVRFIAYVLAGLLAFVAAELVLHSVYGIRSVQGGATHFAVMLAGTLGVGLGWLLSRGQSPGAETHLVGPWEATVQSSTAIAGELENSSG